VNRPVNVPMKATYGNLDVKGGVEQAADGDILIACPGCGTRYNLPKRIFSFDRERISVGPASIKLGLCGWHGYLTDGNWLTATDSACGKLLAKQEGMATMALNKKFKIGDRVDFLRSSNKAVKLRGTVAHVYEDGTPLVEVKLDDSEAIETAHVNDVTLLEEKTAAPTKGDAGVKIY
jgi:hypothetical protein